MRAAACLALLAASPAAVTAQVRPPAVPPRVPVERRPEPRYARPLTDLVDVSILRKADALCRRGARALAALQKPDDGAFNLGNAKNPAPIAVTALCTLALLSTGEVPGRTRFGGNVEHGIRYLVEHQDRSRGDRDGYFTADGDQFSKMHGHGYATLALAQVLGMLPSSDTAIVTQTEVRRALEAAVRLIERCQEPNTGGWYYDPVPRRHEGSITICVAQALRAAKDAGVAVDARVIRNAVRYVERSQKPDGSFRYMLGDDRSTTALTAAAVMTLNASGRFDDPALLRGLAYLTDRSSLAARRIGYRRPLGPRFPYYERLYVGEALFSAKDQSAFTRWYGRIVPELANRVDPRTGLWRSASYSDAYATAMTVLALSLPLQYLPIHQR